MIWKLKNENGPCFITTDSTIFDNIVDATIYVKINKDMLLEKKDNFIIFLQRAKKLERIKRMS